MARGLKFWGLAALLVLAIAYRPVRAEEEEVEDDDEYADVQRAHLVVRKYIPDITDNSLLVEGMNVTVTIDIFNAGMSTASNVKLVDALPAESTLVEGTLEADLGKISIGGHVKHSYKIVFNKGSIQVPIPMAVVQYQPEAESSETTDGQSSEVIVYVMTPVQQIQRYALQAGAYASLGFARTPADWRNLAIVVGVVGTALGVNWSLKKMKASTTNRKRAAALRELEKSD